METITKRYSVEFNRLTDSHYIATVINEGERREVHTAGLTFRQALSLADRLEVTEAVGREQKYMINERTRGDLSAGTIGYIVGYMNAQAIFSPDFDRMEIMPAEWISRINR